MTEKKKHYGFVYRSPILGSVQIANTHYENGLYTFRLRYGENILHTKTIQMDQLSYLKALKIGEEMFLKENG